MSLEHQLREDLTAAMRARDELTTATLRMTLTAVQTEAVSGRTARELSDAEVLQVLTREAKKRREAAEAFDAASRTELAERERAEGGVLARYLPTPLSDDEVAGLVREAIAELGVSGMGAMGQVMKAVTPRTTGRADGGRVSAEVRRQLAS
ncbi:hypothetical protein EV189_0207 [Motilibacter rhizosphaerae]|uniref:GatB/YqeY domain-containing protein n=1 Tax=Motilibacter rhizosphaerae TaxID=598652 RepID=A0A4Q7NUS6_9ACTN|nr:GatB/YqeY domain-containing protein [Motilibacter rhizosphaerae]RZS90976.1 hypothetical protein EV189_0207 [Motilibacter rhizosphaerae]